MIPLLSGKVREPAECVVKVGASQQEITDLYPFLTSVVVETSRSEAAVVQIELETRRSEQGEWTVQDAGIFAPWEAILIEAAFGSVTEEVMRGYVREIRAEYPQDAGATKVRVSGQDESLALDREHMRGEWGAESVTSDAAILQEIAGRHGLVTDPDCGSGLSEVIQLQDGTDICFLRKRAVANGYELIFRQGSIYFGPMRIDGEPQATIMVYAGPDTNCLSFSVRDDGHKPDRVAFEIAATSGAGTTRRVIEPDLTVMGTTSADSSGSGLHDFTWAMSRQGGRNEDAMAAQALRKANDQSMKVSVEGELDGSLYGHVLQVGEPVGVDGVGDRYGGIYYVDSVTHRFDMQGYRQSFKLLRNAYGDNLSSSAGLLAGLI